MTQLSPRVSIIIPVFNGANYLGSAVESALAQTYKNVEIIIIDDGSTDGGATEAIARSFGDSVRYLKKVNGGVSSALNLGILAMTGQYFSWLSHDDFYYPEKLQKQIEYLNVNKNVLILATGLEVIDDVGNIKSSYTTDKFISIKNGRGVMDHWVYGCSLLIHREIFEEVGCFNENNRTVQDLEMWLKIVHTGFSITMMPSILCQWRHHDESDSFKMRASHFNEVGRFLENTASIYPLDFFSDCKDLPLSKKERQAIYLWFAQQSLHRGAPYQARKFCLAGIKEYPNIFDKSFWRLLNKYVLIDPLVNKAF